MSRVCTVCRHPDLVVIDRTIASGSASFRDIADRHGLTKTSVLRHAVNHLQAQVTTGPAAIASEVVKAVRDQRERDRAQTQSVWVGRLHKTYADTVSAYDRAMAEPDGLDSAAKFLMVQARLCDTGLRTDGVLAGAGESRVTVHVEQLVVLPQQQMVRPEPRTIDTDSKDITS